MLQSRLHNGQLHHVDIIQAGQHIEDSEPINHKLYILFRFHHDALAEFQIDNMDFPGIHHYKVCRPETSFHTFIKADLQFHADERIGAFLPCRLNLFNSVGSVILYRFHQFIRIIIRDRPLGPFLQMFFDKVFRHLMSGSPLCRIRGLLIRKLLFQLKGGRAA